MYDLRGYPFKSLRDSPKYTPNTPSLESHGPAKSNIYGGDLSVPQKALSDVFTWVPLYFAR